MSQKVSPHDQLMHLRAMTIRLGSIHEAQRLQFTNWPKLVPGISTRPKDTTANVDCENHVVYIKTRSKNKKFKHTDEVRLWVWQIARWTTSILWPDTKVVFRVNGEVVDPKEPEKDEQR